MFDPAETLFADFLSREKVNIRNCFEPGGNNWKGTKICSLAEMSEDWAKFTENALHEGKLIILGLGYEKYCDSTSGSEALRGF